MNDYVGLMYGAKLLFQFRLDGGGRERKRRVCEERIVNFHARSARTAFNKATRYGESEEYAQETEDGRLYFEFVGVLALDTVVDGEDPEPREVWSEIYERIAPMERSGKLVPPQEELAAFRTGPRRGAIKFRF